MSDPIATAREDGRLTLTESEGKRLLAEAGVATPAFRVVADATSAVDEAETIGYPVVVKVSSPDITHKSEWADGVGVAVGLESADAVRSAAGQIRMAADEREIDVDILVEDALNTGDGTEVIVGGIRDPSFGPVILTGLGGVFAEIFEDTSHRIAPIDAAEAQQAIQELQAARLLQGYRNREPADIDALSEVVRRVGDLIVERRIAEIDVNPVLVNGDGAVALDALIVLEE